MAGVPPVIPRYRFSSSTGAPLASGTVTVYLAGTTTQTNTWQDAAQTTLNTNPITLDANGEALIYLAPDLSYKFVLKNAGGVTQWTQDNITGATGDASVITFTQSGTGAVVRTVQAKLREWISVKDFGAVGDGVTDDTAAILAACVAANAADIQNVLVPPGTYCHTTLDLTDLNVRLIGSGVLSTILKYTGANTADGIKFGSSQLATRKVTGAGLVQITVNANSLARRAVEITSVYGAFFDCVRIQNPYAYGMYWTCLNDRMANAANEPADNQRAYVNELSVECINVPTAVAVFLDGNAGSAAATGANTSLNHFQNIRLNIRDGNGFVFGYSDANTLVGLWVFRPAPNTGVGLVFDKDASSTERHSRYNACFNVQTARASVLAKGGGVGNPSLGNSIFGFNLGNNGVDNPPTIESAASLMVYTTATAFNQTASGVAIVGGATMTAVEGTAALVRSRMTNEGLRVSNRNTNHIQLERPSADVTTVEGQWGLVVAAASGSAGQNLRITRGAGTGVFEVASVALGLQNVTGTTTLTNQSCVVLIDATGGNRTVNLPVANTFGSGRTIVLQVRRIDASANTVTLWAQGTDTINGAASETLAANAGKTYVSNGVGAWYSF
jgi:hypothetical protein